MFDPKIPAVASSLLFPDHTNGEEVLLSSEDEKLFAIEELYDFSTSEFKSSWETMENRHRVVLMKYVDFVLFHDEPNQMLRSINLKTRISAGVPLPSAGCMVRGDGRVILISADRKLLRSFDLERKTRIFASVTEEEFLFADWIDGEHMVVLEGSSLYLVNVLQSQEKEVIMEGISNDFKSDIVSITRNLEFYAIHKIQNGQYSFLLIKPQVKMSQQVNHSMTKGICLLEGLEKLVMIGHNNNIMFMEPTRKDNKVYTKIQENAYMSHYLKDGQLVVFIGHKGDCLIVECSSNSVIAQHDFKTDIVNSFKLDDNTITILQNDGKVFQCSLNPTRILFLLRNTEKVSTEVFDYWKNLQQYSSNKQFTLSSIKSLIPLKSPLKKYSFPSFYKYIIRNEMNIEYTVDELDIIKGFVDYLIYGGSNLIIDRENLLKWMFIFDRCWGEFSELEEKIILLFNNLFNSISDYSPLLQQLEEFHSRNYKFENGLLQKCSNVCRDAVEKKGIFKVEPLKLEHNPVKLSLECIYNCQNYDIVLNAFGKRIESHKTVLSSSSSVLEVMLDEKSSFQSEVTANNELVLGGDETLSEKEKQKKGDLFQLLVRFCYTSDITCTPEDAFILYEMADQYQVEELKKSLVGQILAQLNIESFMEIIKWSDMFAPISNKYLHDKITHFAETNGKKVLELYSAELVAFPEFLLRLLKHKFNVE